jgi:hypothetical protein
VTGPVVNPGSNITIDASQGFDALKSAVESAQPGTTVNVTGTGTITGSGLAVPEGVTLNVSDQVQLQLGTTPIGAPVSSEVVGSATTTVPVTIGTLDVPPEQIVGATGTVEFSQGQPAGAVGVISGTVAPVIEGTVTTGPLITEQTGAVTTSTVTVSEQPAAKVPARRRPGSGGDVTAAAKPATVSRANAPEKIEDAMQLIKIARARQAAADASRSVKRKR